jgi:hypothetical protein
MGVPELKDLDEDCHICSIRGMVAFRCEDGSRLVLCLKHGMAEECIGCGGKPVWQCGISGCGDWKPCNDAARKLVHDLWEYETNTENTYNPFEPAR